MATEITLCGHSLFKVLNMCTNLNEIPLELLKIVADSYFCSVEQFQRTIKPAQQLMVFYEYIKGLEKLRPKVLWKPSVQDFIRNYAGIYQYYCIRDSRKLECFNINKDEQKDGVWISVSDTSIEQGKL